VLFLQTTEAPHHTEQSLRKRVRPNAGLRGVSLGGMLTRICNACSRPYDPNGGYHASGKCQACTRTYEREKARRSPSRLIRNSARFKKLRARIKARDHHQCQQCGSSHRLDVHHRVPLNQGGEPFDPANLITLCSGCHTETMHRPITQPRPRFSRQVLR
jgi:hypothetical protein